MIVIYLISAVAAILFMKFYLYKRRMMKYVGHLPALPEIPIVGSGLYFIGKNTIAEIIYFGHPKSLPKLPQPLSNLFDLMNSYSHLFTVGRKYEITARSEASPPERKIMDTLCITTELLDTPCRFWLGPFLAVFLGKPEDVQTVLLSPKCLEKPYIYRFMDVNLGLFTAPIHVWKPQRKLLNPTFNNKILLSFIPIFNERSQVLVETLGKRVGEKAFDISKQFLACTLEMVCATTIGYDFDFQGSKNVELLDAMESQSSLIANRMTKFWLHPDWFYKWTDDYKSYRHGTAIVYDIPKAIRKRKLLEFDENYFKNHKELKEDEFYSTPQIFINELLKLHQKNLIDEQTLDDQIVTVLVGGNETSALSMSNIMLMLAMHPEVQEKAFQEIKDCHETQTSPSDAEILAKLDYLEMCIKEAMRLFPVAPFLGRQNMEDIQLSNCTIPKGTMLVLSCHYLHRNKEVWGPNADKFDPDNFLPEKVASRHAYSYLPFSGGGRNCIGIKYAWLSMKIMLAAIMRQYKFSTHLKLEDIVTKFEVTLKIDNCHMVTVERREKY